MSVCWKEAAIHCHRQAETGYCGVSCRITGHPSSSQLCTRLGRGSRIRDNPVERTKGTKWLPQKRQLYLLESSYGQWHPGVWLIHLGHLGGATKLSLSWQYSAGELSKCTLQRVPKLVPPPLPSPHSLTVCLTAPQLLLLLFLPSSNSQGQNPTSSTSSLLHTSLCIKPPSRCNSGR